MSLKIKTLVWVITENACFSLPLQMLSFHTSCQFHFLHSPIRLWMLLLSWLTRALIYIFCLIFTFVGERFSTILRVKAFSFQRFANSKRASHETHQGICMFQFGIPQLLHQLTCLDHGPYFQGRNEGAKAQCPGRRKVPTMSQVLSSAQHICSRNSLSRFEHGGAKFVSCPGCHLTSVRPCILHVLFLMLIPVCYFWKLEPKCCFFCPIDSRHWL